MTEKIKLFYFDVAGKGEPIRLACIYGNLPFEDIRVDREGFEELIDEGRLTFGQLPALEVNGVMITQSAAIMRFIGKRVGLYPTNDDVQAAIIDSILDEEIDLFMGLSVSRYRDRFGFGCLDSDTVELVRKTLSEDVLPRHLGFLEALLAKSHSGWLAGGECPSIADFVLVPRLQWLASGANDHIPTTILDRFPKIQHLISKFMSLPAIVHYYESRNKV